MSFRFRLGLLGSLLLIYGVTEQGWALLAVWLGADFLALAVAHSRGAHGIFGKRPDGTLPWWSWALFLPLIIYSFAVWHLLRFLSREPARCQVNEQLSVGRRLYPAEFKAEVENFVDLTAEFAEPRMLRSARAYYSFPILDGAAPSTEALRKAVAGLRPGRTFIHCAQGHGRTGLFALAVLLSTGAAPNIEAGLRMLKAARPGVRLNREQSKCIQAYAKELFGFG